MAEAHNGWRALPAHLRPLARWYRLLELIGRAPTVAQVAAKSLQERQNGKPARWACRPVTGDVQVDDRVVATRDGAVTVRIYRASSSVGSHPVLLYFHGGGWIMGGLDGIDPLCRRLALDADVTVVSVDYRLAPEHRFPAALHDCADVLAWIRRDGAELGMDPARIAVAGDSAGGNLAAALTLLDRGATQPLRAQVLLYPSVDLRMTSDYFTHFRGPGLTQKQCRELVDLYLTSPSERTNPLASPLLADHHRDLPPALVLTGGADILAHDGEVYVEALLAAGTEARLLHYPRAPHAFLGFDRLLSEAAQAIDELPRFLRARLRADAPATR